MLNKRYFSWSNDASLPEAKRVREALSKEEEEKEALSLAKSLAIVFQFRDMCAAVLVFEKKPNSLERKGYITTNGIHSNSRIDLETQGVLRKNILEMINYFRLLEIWVVSNDEEKNILTTLKEKRVRLAVSMAKGWLMSTYKKEAAKVQRLSEQFETKLAEKILLPCAEKTIEVDISQIYYELMNKPLRNTDVKSNALLYWEALRHFTKALKKIEQEILDSKLQLKLEIVNIDADKVHAEMKLLSKLLEMGFFTDPEYKEKKVYLGTSKVCCRNCHLMLNAVKKVLAEYDWGGGEIIFKNTTHQLEFTGWEGPAYFFSEEEKEMLDHNDKLNFAATVIAQYHTDKQAAASLGTPVEKPATEQKKAGQNEPKAAMDESSSEEEFLVFNQYRELARRNEKKDEFLERIGNLTLFQTQIMKLERGLCIPVMNPTVNIDQRKGVKSVSTYDLKDSLNLTVRWVPGKSIDNGGCFFDSMAQILNSMNYPDGPYDEKRLRLLCYDYYQHHHDEVNQLFILRDEAIDEKYENIQFTAEELKDTPLWGRVAVEGCIICLALEEKTREKLAIIHCELLKNPQKNQWLPNYYLCTSTSYEHLIDHQFDNMPFLVTPQGELHTIPVLPTQALSQDEYLIFLTELLTEACTHLAEDDNRKLRIERNRRLAASAIVQLNLQVKEDAISLLEECCQVLELYKSSDATLLSSSPLQFHQASGPTGQSPLIAHSLLRSTPDIPFFSNNAPQFADGIIYQVSADEGYHYVMLDKLFQALPFDDYRVLHEQLQTILQGEAGWLSHQCRQETRYPEQGPIQQLGFSSKEAAIQLISMLEALCELSTNPTYRR